MILHRLLFNAALGGLMALATEPALAFPDNPVTVTDPAGTNQQAVDSNNNAFVAPRATTTGGALALCTHQIQNVPNGCTTGTASHQVYVYQFDNSLNTLPTWFEVFDALHGSVTTGSTQPHEIIEVPPGASEIIPISVGDSFSTQITLVCATAPYPNDTTGPHATCGYTIWGQ